MASSDDSSEAATFDEQMASIEFAELLANLERMPGVSQNSKPVKPANKPNHFGVSVKLKLPERSRLQKRFAVTKPDGERPTLVAAAREAIKSAIPGFPRQMSPFSGHAILCKQGRWGRGAVPLV